MKVYTYNNKVLTNSANGKWLKKYVDPCNPLELPPLTIRIKFSAGYNPAPSYAYPPITVTAVTGQPDIYDICLNRTDSWSQFFRGDTHIIEILGANTTGVTNMFESFTSCTALTSIPLFDTSSLTDVREIFADCYNVQSGALALYQQMSTQANPPSTHLEAFYRCGSNTVTGAAELAQIPSSWGGEGA